MQSEKAFYCPSARWLGRIKRTILSELGVVFRGELGGCGLKSWRCRILVVQLFWCAARGHVISA